MVNFNLPAAATAKDFMREWWSRKGLENKLDKMQRFPLLVLGSLGRKETIEASTSLLDPKMTCWNKYL